MVILTKHSAQIRTALFAHEHTRFALNEPLVTAEAAKNAVAISYISIAEPPQNRNDWPSAAGANKYTFIFDNDPETIVVDGTDQPGIFGTTLSVTADAPNTWKVVRKANGRMLISAIWTLSSDGQMLRDDFTGYQPNGSTYHLDYIYKRMAGSSGFAGTWESTSEKVDSVFEP